LRVPDSAWVRPLGQFHADGAVPALARVQSHSVQQVGSAQGLRLTAQRIDYELRSQLPNCHEGRHSCNQDLEE